MTYQNRQHGHPKSERQQQSENDLYTFALVMLLAAAPSIVAVLVLLNVPSLQTDWVARGWLAPASESVLSIGVAGFDAARLTLPIGNAVIALAYGFSYLAHVARREKSAPYRVWQRETITAIVAAVWAAQALPAMLGVPVALGWLLALWCVGLGVFAGVLGVRTNRRNSDRGRLIEQIAPLVGDQIKNRKLVTATGWTQQWPTGIPQKVRINYPNAVLEHDPERLAEILERVSRIGWGPYLIDRTDPRKHQLVLVPCSEPETHAIPASWPRPAKTAEHNALRYRR